MELELKMPELATTGGAVTIVQWLVDTGTQVKRGQEILEVETDKAAMAVECHRPGILTKQLVNAGDAVESGQVYGILEVADAADSASAKKPAPQKTDDDKLATTTSNPPVAPPATEAAATPAKATSSDAKANSNVATKRISFFERNRQRVNQKAAAGINMPATASVPAAAPAPSVSLPVTPGEAIPLSKIQQITAQRLSESKRTIPHFYLSLAIDAQAMATYRANAPTKLVWDAFYVKAMAVALEKFPRMGYLFADTELRPSPSEAIGVAMDVAGDLVVVPVENPAQKTFDEISAEIRFAADLLKSGSRRVKLGPGVLTVTNLGVTGVEQFQAIVNPPEAAILAIGKAQEELVLVEGHAEIRSRAKVTLSADHRVVNGRYAAGFLDAVKHYLENIQST